MAKFCKNGHEMDDSWPDCPYCVKPGPKFSIPGGLDLTRPDTERGHPETAPSFDPGATVVISTIRKTPVVGWLVALNGEQKGEDFRLREGKNTLGTKVGSEITLRDQAVSSIHASLSYKEGKFLLIDLDSRNGTFLNNDEECVSRAELKDNDTIRVGETSLKFKCL